MDKICQSCGMPLQDDKYLSSNADGSVNTTYCFYCYKGGEFIDGCTTLEQKMEDCIAIATQSGVPKKRAEDMAKSILPNLKRWQ
ncbi:MAG: transcriptional regulator [Flavobacteriales bacterium]|nr:MAG: transcriptional regulator [Flavobacteriales bacterium]